MPLNYAPTGSKGTPRVGDGQMRPSNVKTVSDDVLEYRIEFGPATAYTSGGTGTGL